MRDDAVRGLQQFLKAKGFFKVKVDGVFDLKTRAAVKNTQRKYQQELNGIVDTADFVPMIYRVNGENYVVRVSCPCGCAS
ncbi:MAG: peptidoglycan-binding protein [Trichodesmium sp. MAG_R03]|nr:peptidoglycan-binding protein [Trichodesmium sp. MAG_R03]